LAERRNDFRLLSAMETQGGVSSSSSSFSSTPSPKFTISRTTTTATSERDTNVRYRILEDGEGDDTLNDDDGQQEACDGQFMKCLPNARCVDCFATLELEEIDWTGVTSGTSCNDVIAFLTAGNHCKSLDGDDTAKELFCSTFDACVVWDDDSGSNRGYDSDDDGFDPDYVDCSRLTECEWDGMHTNWIGDGVCHDNVHGCYNTEICGYDGGDCCEDTCEIDDSSSYTECGHDGYACRDPESKNCNPKLSRFCPSSGGGGSSSKDSVICEADQVKYRLVMYDSFGDGWDTTALTISPEGTDDVTFKGGLVDGYQGTEYICLSRTAQCYNVKTEGGTWGGMSS
jgi:hypothetical protein